MEVPMSGRALRVRSITCDRVGLVVGVLAVLLSVLLWCGCVLRWKGQDAIELSPDADVWIHHPETGGTNRVPTP